jgi:hypothetical protein
MVQQASSAARPLRALWVPAVLLCLLVLQAHSQPLRGPRNKKPPRDPKQNTHHTALTINYPLHFFDAAHADLDWRKVARYSPELVSSSEATRAWSEHSFAQDQEDVWLYENWFYGMTEGVIMESGALNGVLFSNSNLFEAFANWTAIHVGS